MVESEDHMAIIVASGYMDRLLSTLILSSGGAAAGTKVSLFFTLWGTPMLVKKAKYAKCTCLQRLFKFMVPKGAKKLPLSRLNMLGLGPRLMRKLMRQYNIASVEELLSVCQDLDVKFFICDMTMNMMGFRREEMREIKNLEYCGVGTFMEVASRAKHILYV